jgi:hypothetical protein
MIARQMTMKAELIKWLLIVAAAIAIALAIATALAQVVG